MVSRFLFIATLSILNSFAHAEPLTLSSQIQAAPSYPGYEESLNLAPAFHVWQNDPELSDYFVNSSVSDLCIPTTMADLLLYQAVRRPKPLTALTPSLLGITSGQVDGAELVKTLINVCGFTPKTKANKAGYISWSYATSCLQRFYQNVGYKDASIHYIRIDAIQTEGVVYEKRQPTLTDIRDALKNGSEVIAVISFLAKDPVTSAWKEKSSHSINLFGYASHGDNLTEEMAVAIQNGNRLYNMDFKNPVFDLLRLTVNKEGSLLPDFTSGIEITTLQGRLINFPDQRTFLTGLIIVKPDSTP